MTFDRKAYQKEYMKEYMRKHRGPWDDCIKCSLFKSYCDGGHKVSECPKAKQSPEGLEVTDLNDKYEYLDGRMKLSQVHYVELLRRKREPDEPMDKVIRRILDGDIWERDDFSQIKKINLTRETHMRLNKLRLNNKESFNDIINRILDEKVKT
jgi:hypothetical protein